MNLLLLDDADFQPDGTALLEGRRARHAHEVLAACEGEAFRVGRLGGLLGEGCVLESTPKRLHLSVQLDRPPPPRLGIDVLLAVPRPKALKKVLPALASLGVGRIVLVNAFRVEKSYFTSKVLQAAALQEALIAGLEQAQDTVLPEVFLKERFRPFVEDELDAMFGDARRLLAHPHAAQDLDGSLFDVPGQPAVVAIGPEGGWIPFELELLERRGFLPFSLGPRTLRVEAVVPYLLGQVAALRKEPRGAAVLVRGSGVAQE